MKVNQHLQDAYNWFSGAPLHIVVILVVACVIQTFGGRAVMRAMDRIATADFVPGPQRTVARQKERARTLGSILKSTLNGTVWVIASAMLLSEFGLNLGPIIASDLDLEHKQSFAIFWQESSCLLKINMVLAMKLKHWK